MTNTNTKWEVRDRTYLLNGNRTPLTHKVRATGILWFDEDAQINREIRYTTNQRSLFKDEQDGAARLGHIIFTDGALFVPRTNPLLQQLLSIYHPLAGRKWHEVDTVKDAADEMDAYELELKAAGLVQKMAPEELEAILRTELGSTVTTMSSKELKRDAYRFAKSNPTLFIELTEDDDLKLRNLANRSVEAGILKLTDDGTVFKLVKTDKKVLTVPFDTNPYAALAQYFKTDEGVTLMKSIIKKIS